MRDVGSWVTTLLTVALASTWLSACSSTVAGGPCDGDSPAAACSQSCGTGAAACPTGFYCGTSGTCSADCDATSGSGCASGHRCDSYGRCVSAIDGSTSDGSASGFDAGPRVGSTDAAPPDNTCADVMLDGAHTTPNVILLVDRSRSMDTDFDMGMTRWDVLQNAILANPSGLVASLQHSVRFGLALFTGSSRRGGTCPDS